MSTHNTSSTSTPPVGPRGASGADPTAISDPDALRNLIVNYLPPLMDEAQFFQLFSQFGPIQSVKIIFDRVTGESRGYGFIKYQYFFSATYAISCLNRFEIAGKKLKVAYANAEAAKEAYEMLRLSAVAFTMQQQLAMQAMYYNQMMMTQDQPQQGYGGAMDGRRHSGAGSRMGGGGGYAGMGRGFASAVVPNAL